MPLTPVDSNYWHTDPLLPLLDINECDDDICDANANCDNTPGSYVCSCKVGFEDDGNACRDINECRQTAVCPLHATCENTEGSYKCPCESGFQAQNELCQDINECLADLGICQANSNCVNTAGSYSCECSTGYVADSEGDCQGNARNK